MKNANVLKINVCNSGLGILGYHFYHFTMKSLFRMFHLVPLIALSLISASALNGCAAVSAVAAVANAASGAMGLNKGEPEPKEVKLAIHAGSNLNASSGTAMALVVKIYHLKGIDAFSQMPASAFNDVDIEKKMLGQSLINVREVTLTPGQHYENVDKISPEASNIGIVALFHSPAPQRWKFVFDTTKAEDKGILIGIQACAMSVSTGDPILPVGSTRFDPSRLSSVTCPR